MRKLGWDRRRNSMPLSVAALSSAVILFLATSTIEVLGDTPQAAIEEKAAEGFSGAAAIHTAKMGSNIEN
jgi:hypothetical protein